MGKLHSVHAFLQKVPNLCKNLMTLFPSLYAGKKPDYFESQMKLNAKRPTQHKSVKSLILLLTQPMTFRYFNPEP